jgi:nucleoside-diphosphate-sugar epimerase
MARQINVEGSRNVLELAYELGVPRIIYTSTLAVFGDTHGRVVDESYRMPASEPFITEYDRTKWLAHYDVAQPLIEKGAPITIIMPGAVFGPGDQSLIGDMMQAFYRGLLFVFPGPETVLSFTHVDDIAEGHLLAAEKGKAGESYILTGPALSLRQIVPLWAQASGRSVPLAYVPARLLHPLIPLADRLGERIAAWPQIFSVDAIRVTGTTYAAQASKAQRELGWYPRSLEEGLKDTFDAIAEQAHRPTSSLLSSPIPPEKRKLVAGVIVGIALGLLLIWKITRRRK